MPSYKPIKATKVCIERGPGSIGAGIDGPLRGAGVQITLYNTGKHVDSDRIYRQLRRVLERHLDEIVDLPKGAKVEIDTRHWGSNF